MEREGYTDKNDYRSTRRRFIKLTGSSAILAGLGVFSLHIPLSSYGRSQKPYEKSELRWLSGRTSTVDWSGDLIILGATLTGVALALLAARMNKKVLLIENGPSLGTEVSLHWNGFISPGWFADELSLISKLYGGFRDGWFDPFINTLAIDRLTTFDGVSCLVCVTATRPVNNKAGLINGLEIVGKSGRQIVTASRIIDAGIGLTFSRRILGLATLKKISGTCRMYLHGVERTVMGTRIKVAEVLHIKNNEVEIFPAIWPDESILQFTYYASENQYNNTPLSADNYHRGIVLLEYLRRQNPAFTRVLLVDIAPEGQPDFNSDTSTTFPALESTGLYPVPESLKAISDKSSAVSFLTEIFGTEPQRALNNASVLPENENEMIATCELSAASERNLETCLLPVATVKWHPTSDVVVVGCGTGGAFAAIAAAQQGSQVTVLDALGIPGGTGIRSKVHSYYHGINSGMQVTIDQKITQTMSITGNASGYHPIAKAETLFEEMVGAGVTFGVNGRLFGVTKNGKAVTGVIVACQDGYHGYPCRVAIDSTGDGDLAAAAGAKYSIGRTSDGLPFFFGYLPSTVIKGGSGWVVRGANNMLGCADATDTLDYSRAYFEGRAALWKQGPFTNEKHYCTLATLLGMRQSRTIHGPVVLGAEDFSNGKSWPDKVCSMSSNFDRAGFFALESEWMQRWIVLFGLWPQLWTGEIPYRCLYPEGVEGILLACRAFSVEHDVQSLARMQRDMQQLGEICGLAAAFAIKSGKMPSKINVYALQEILRQKGILPLNPPENILAVSSQELLKELGGKQNGIAMWRLSQLRKKDAPDWKLFSETEKDDRKLLCGAIAACLSDTMPPPALLKILEKTIDERLEGPVLGERSSPLCIVAGLSLSYAKAPGIVDRLVELLADVTKYPFIRIMDIALIYNALHISGKEKAIQPIRNHLSKLALPKTTDEYQLLFAGVRVLQSLGCFDESYRLKSHLDSDNLLIKKAGLRLARDAGGKDKSV